MKRNLTTFTAMCLIFLLLLASAGVTSGVFSEILYYSAFILPTILGIIADNKLRKEESEHDREYPEPKNLFRISSEGVRRFLPLIFPTVALVFLISVLSSALIGALFGVESTVDVGDNLVLALLSHALLPALLEELLFRYMPMRMLARHSVRLTIVISSLYFALVHNSFFSMPYALVAGIIFMSVNLMCESIIPSVILHFSNNAISVLWLFYAGEPKYAIIISIALAILSFISVIPIIIQWKRYASAIKNLLSSGDSCKIGYTPLAIAVPTLFLAISELL
ncbi:MAG: CPBP family intramembrane metalloprotease [Clostridia bacterium]|nr:CPBP family intramembrane metalloprotease [Clostridia bacterium]